MFKGKRHVIAGFLAATLVFGAVLSGCSSTKESEETEKKAEATKIEAVMYNELGNTVKSIDELPDWQGKKLNLKLWMAHGTNAPDIGKKATKDVFRDELARVTGITFDAENSFDNKGESADARLAMLVASDNLPDVAINLFGSTITSLQKANKIYSLDEAVSKYATNYMEIVKSSPLLETLYNSKKVDGKLYSFPQMKAAYIKYSQPNYDAKKYMSIVKPVDTKGYIWVRDDIIKTLYPNAKNMNEIEQEYVKNGEFTKENMTDVTIKNFEEYKNLLSAIDKLNLKEGARKVYPTYTHNGTDNWDLLTVFNGQMNGVSDGNALNYFSYFDVAQGEILPTYKQQWFKDNLKFYVSLIWDGLASKEAIVDNAAAFNQKKNNGEYAVIYGNTAPPTDAVLEQGGKSYRYRKVMIDTTLDPNKYRRPNPDSSIFDGWSVTVFNQNIKPEDVEQIVRLLDFGFTTAGMKYVQFGPQKSGLYTENSDGSIKFTDPNMETEVFAKKTDALIAAGQGSWPQLTYFMSPNFMSATVVAPKAATINPATWSTYWNFGLIEKAPIYPMLTKGDAIYNYTSGDVAGVKKFWDARQAFEDAVKIIFTAKNEQEFEKLYTNMVELAERNGLDDTTFTEFNKKFNEANKDVIEAFKNWKPEK